MTGNVEKLEKRYPTLTYENLDVWQKAFAVSVQAHKMTLDLPKIEQYALADQMRRSSKSICSNIAEGFAKQKSSKIEFKRFLLMAFGSANQMLVWLKYCLELEYISKEQFAAWNAEYISISKMINSLHQKIS